MYTRKDCHSSPILQMFCTRYASAIFEEQIVDNRLHVNFLLKFVFDVKKSEVFSSLLFMHARS